MPGRRFVAAALAASLCQQWAAWPDPARAAALSESASPAVPGPTAAPAFRGAPDLQSIELPGHRLDTGIEVWAASPLLFASAPRLAPPRAQGPPASRRPLAPASLLPGADPVPGLSPNSADRHAVAQIDIGPLGEVLPARSESLHAFVITPSRIERTQTRSIRVDSGPIEPSSKPPGRPATPSKTCASDVTAAAYEREAERPPETRLLWLIETLKASWRATVTLFTAIFDSDVRRRLDVDC